MQDLILVGIQGSGKGTQSRILAEKFGYVIFETGGELRRIAQEDSELGRKVKAITERGDLVPNDIVMEIVEHFVSGISAETPVIFDGIPRSEPQRQTLEALLAKLGRDFRVLEITLSEGEAMSRLLRRAEIEGRADDNEAAIRRRIENFHTYTAPLIAVWREQDRVIEVDGDAGVDDVTAEILAQLAP